MQHTTAVRLLGFVVLTVIANSVAHAEEAWRELAPGVTYLSRTAATQRVYAVRVDLDAPGVSLVATRRGDRGRTVSSFAALEGALVAVNGDFFESDFATEGLAMGHGEMWSGSSDGTKWGFVALGDGRAEISLPPVVGAAEAWMTGIVGGYPLLVDDGAVAAATACDTSFCRRNPRTAVGLADGGRALLLVVVDGREGEAVGMSLAELAALLVELGAERALNLDGGGSSAMFVGGAIVNVPSDGHERRVANHLGVRVVPAPDAALPSAPDAAPAVELVVDDGDVGGGCTVGRASPASALLVCAWLLARRSLA